MKIKYAQIGTKHAHANKIRVYRESPDYEVIGIVEADPHARRRAQADPIYRDLPWMTENELLNLPGLQVVGVETEVKDLLPTAQRCIDAGKHIHLDKPAGESFPQFERLLNDAAKKHLIVQMGYMYRYNPGIVMLRDWVQRGWLGTPFEIHAVMSKRVADSRRKEFELYRGGTMFELGCHLIDLVVGLLGPPDHVHSFPRHSADVQDHCWDNMLAVFEYARATVTVRSSIIEADGFARRHFTLCGTGGTFHIQPLDQPSATIALRERRPGHDPATHSHRLPPYTRYVADAADLAKVIRHEKDPAYSYAHDLSVQKTVLLASELPLD